MVSPQEASRSFPTLRWWNHIQCLLDVVICNEDANAALAQVTYLILDVVDRDGIHPGKGLIKQKKSRFGHQCPCDLSTTALSSGKSIGLLVLDTLDSKVDKQVVLQDAFIPSVSNTRTATVLDSFMNEFLGMLHQRGEALGGRVAQTGRGGAAEISDFLLLQVVNRLQPLLAHLAAEANVHPEDLFRVCIMAAGELATFTHASKRAGEFPAYQHDDLRASFEPVIAVIRECLSSVLETTATPIPLKAKKYGISVASVADKGLFNSSNFVLAVNADIPTETLRTQFPAQIKIGSVEKIRELVNLSLPGIQAAPLPVAVSQTASAGKLETAFPSMPPSGRARVGNVPGNSIW